MRHQIKKALKTWWVAIAIGVLIGITCLGFRIGIGDGEWVEGRPTGSALALNSDAKSFDTSSSGAGQASAKSEIPASPLNPKNQPKNSAAQPVRIVQAANQDIHQVLSTACAIRPGKPRRPTAQELALVRYDLPLSRFRQGEGATAQLPREVIALAHPTNFGLRFLQDINGRAVQNAPIVVLHETVASAQSTLNFFQTPHANDDDQVSYHALVDLDGTIFYTVPPDKRAFGAGNSTFVSLARVEEGVRTNPKYPPSVNNFAYHISLITPVDGRNNRSSHSGYTKPQYESLAWLVALTGVPEDRITTHQLIDRSRSRMDPRSFNARYFLERLRSYPKSNAIPIQCIGGGNTAVNQSSTS
ncbi:MAG: peptidoglycan recognition family protein [Synechococcales bacterium]|nr:peptidoglycan recognition family protein [Synechococcales bacterium]